jgi:hypothetical protein
MNDPLPTMFFSAMPDHVRDRFKSAWRKWLTWCGEHGVQPVDATAKTAPLPRIADLHPGNAPGAGIHQDGVVGPCPPDRAPQRMGHTCASALRIRFSETFTGVPSCWAKKLTRSSSISQRTSSSVASRAGSGASRSDASMAAS